MSSNLLIDEPPLQVLPSLAMAVGLNESIILQQIHYWLRHKQADKVKYEGSFKDGRWWVYNSVVEWQKQFPFWSDNTIQRALTSLKAQGVLIVQQLAEDTRDRTNWYSIDYGRLKGLAASSAGGAAKVGQSITPKRDNASPQSGVMASSQSGTMQGRKMGQCQTKTPSENTQKQEVFAALLGEEKRLSNKQGAAKFRAAVEAARQGKPA